MILEKNILKIELYIFLCFYIISFIFTLFLYFFILNLFEESSISIVLFSAFISISLGILIIHKRNSLFNLSRMFVEKILKKKQNLKQPFDVNNLLKELKK